MEVLYWNEKIEKFINDLDCVTSSRVRRTIYILEKFGHLLGMPDSKSLGKGLFELRTHGKKQVRIIYFFKNNKAHIIHGFFKKTGKIPYSDMEYARKIQKEIMTLA